MIKFVALIIATCLFQGQAINPTSDKNGRIIGGEAAFAGEYPFMAAIYKSTGTGNYFCAGTIIYNQWILTSGQCASNGQLFTIRLGSNNLNDPNSLRVAAEEFFLHPEFNASTLENDIALIKLRGPIEFTDYIKPISLLSSASVQPGATVLTAGWGQTSDDDPGIVDALHEVALVTISNDECKNTYGAQVTENMVCAAGNFNEGLCRGDLGGPLFQSGLVLKYHVGIASFISSRGCENTDPSGFTRTAPYVSWIQNVTANY